MTAQTGTDAASRGAGPDDTQLAHAARQALRRMANTVSVITCSTTNGPYAMTATAVSSLSMAPPSLLVCINRSARIHDQIALAPHFAVNILSREQTPVSKACGGLRDGRDRFEIGGWDLTGAVPVLSGAQATIVCQRADATAFGTHTIFIGEIVSASVHGEIDPLVYCAGNYVERPLGGA